MPAEDYQMGIMQSNLRRSSDISITYSTSHSESTKELANPPKNGTSNRSKPSAAAISVSIWKSGMVNNYTVSVGMHSKESNEAYVNDEQHPR